MRRQDLGLSSQCGKVRSARRQCRSDGARLSPHGCVNITRYPDAFGQRMIFKHRMRRSASLTILVLLYTADPSLSRELALALSSSSS